MVELDRITEMEEDRRLQLQGHNLKVESLESSMNDHHHRHGGEDVAVTVDWRGRPSNPAKHGGIKAASFVLGTYTYTLRFLYIYLDNIAVCVVYINYAYLLISSPLFACL